MSKTLADRNLLLGTLAYQNAFITRNQLLAAMQAWLHDKARPLAEILREQQALDEPRRVLLEALVEQHVQAHGGDPQQSLDSICSANNIRIDLERLPAPALQASVQHLGRRSPSTPGMSQEVDPYATQGSIENSGGSAGNSTSIGTRFVIVRPHAKGGLGEVFVARDTELNREVALKEIQGKHADNAHSRARFLLEAEITGGLEHPGIVPVYGLGTYADGRPFYAMRFIRGESLKEAIADFHQAGAAPRQEVAGPGRLAFKSLPFRQLLRRFLDVCNALQYAHDRGVLHRDLKPANIMLGPYGETLVVDWGLAKARGAVSKPSGEETALRSGASDARTRFAEKPLLPASGSAVAETLAGAAIGTPSFMSPEQAAGAGDELGPGSDVYSLGATLYCLLTGRPPFAAADAGQVLRLVVRGDFPPPSQSAPAVPKALEAVCLKAMSLRPADRYASPRALADDVEHWLADEPVSACVEPWTVRTGRWVRRHKPLVSGAAAALLVAVVGTVVGFFWHQGEQARRATELAMRQQAIRTALDQAEQTRNDLHAALKKPGGVFDLLNRPHNWELQIKAARNALHQGKELLASSKDADPDLTGRVAQLEALLRQDDADRLLALRLEKIRLDRATLINGKLDYKTGTQKYAEAFSEAGLPLNEPSVAAERVRASAVKEQLVAALDDWMRTWTGYDETLSLIIRLATPDPDWGDRLRQPTFRLDVKAMLALAGAGPPPGLSPQLLALVGAWLPQQAKEVWLRQAQAQYPSDFWLNFDLANAISKTNRLEAIGFFRVALVVRPNTSAAHYSLGVALRDQKQLPEAIASFRKAIEVDPKLALAHYILGVALSEQKQMPEAIAAYQKAIEVDPKNARAHYSLGVALRDQKQLPEAIAAFRKSIKLNPKDAIVHHNLGLALHFQNELPEALAAFRKAVELDPKLALAHSSLGLALLVQNLLPEAVVAFRRAIELDPKLALAHSNLGLALGGQKQLPEAIAAFRKAIELDPKLALAHTNLGLALSDQKELPEAIAAFRKASELDPKSTSAHNYLGLALRHQKQLPEAAAAFHKVAELDPKNVLAHGNLGQIFLQQGRFADAMAASKKALDLLPANTPLRREVLGDLKQAERLLDLEKQLAPTLEGGPAKPVLLLDLASMCIRYKSRYATAAKLYEQAFQAGPDLAAALDKQHRYNAACAAALAGAGRGDEAAQLSPQEQARLRRSALAWLQGDLDLYAARLKLGKAADVVLVEERLAHWQQDADLAAGRDPKQRAALPQEEQPGWQELWARTDAFLEDARARFTETRRQGALTAKEASQVHEVKLNTGTSYVIDLESKAFDAFLILELPGGKKLAENDDISLYNRNSRLVVIPTEDAVYRVVATSFERRGTGAYTLRLRAIADRK